MSEIAPIGRPSATALETGHQTTRPVATPEGRNRANDSVELSQTAKYLSKLAELPDVRQDLVDRVRTEIELGSYDSDDKIDAIIDAITDDLSVDDVL